MAALVAALAGCAPQPRVLVAGDSLAGAYFASSQESAFRGILYSELEVADDNRLRYGFPHGKLSDLDDAPLPADVTVAVIEIGTNDFGQTPLADFHDGYQAFVERVTTRSPDVRLICLGLWQPTDARSNGSVPADYDILIKEVCDESGGTFIRLSGIFDEEGTRGPADVETPTGTSDAFHPNDEGHAKIAAAVLAVLAKE